MAVLFHQILLRSTKLFTLDALILISLAAGFKQPRYKVHSQLEELFIKSTKGSDYQSEYEFVMTVTIVVHLKFNYKPIHNYIKYDKGREKQILTDL